MIIYLGSRVVEVVLLCYLMIHMGGGGLRPPGSFVLHNIPAPPREGRKVTSSNLPGQSEQTRILVLIRIFFTITINTYFFYNYNYTFAKLWCTLLHIDCLLLLLWVLTMSSRARWDMTQNLKNLNIYPPKCIWMGNLILKLVCFLKLFDLSAPSGVFGPILFFGRAAGKTGPKRSKKCNFPKLAHKWLTLRTKGNSIIFWGCWVYKPMD